MRHGSRELYSLMAAGRNDLRRRSFLQWDRRILSLNVLLCPCSILWSAWEGFLMIAGQHPALSCHRHCIQSPLRTEPTFLMTLFSLLVSLDVILLPQHTKVGTGLACPAPVSSWHLAGAGYADTSSQSCLRGSCVPPPSPH